MQRRGPQGRSAGENRAEADAVAERTAEPPRGDRVTVRVAHKLGSVGPEVGVLPGWQMNVNVNGFCWRSEKI